VPSTKNPSTRPVASIARAAQRTKSVIEDFQTRLTEVSQHAGLARLGAAVATEKETEHFPRAAGADTTDASESEAELERQLAAYFARASAPIGSAATGASDRNKILEELRARVIDAVVERMLADWSSGQPREPSALRDEVLERLIERVLQQFGTGRPAETEARPS
jgi:hypothetical protein